MPTILIQIALTIIIIRFAYGFYLLTQSSHATDKHNFLDLLYHASVIIVAWWLIPGFW
ncbi:hypothetical protein [Mechercharimyces sp. CAU 1602]|uniref:hypothetical protein n=1 Tax=Mechercharimyces sp. CAU 1602 TaxID=2973933 RepID=UPI0021612825|nr:hypothetical protein [Mechercharimyces sp. CAU 1602]MCS1351020.1 hypothetical protein [Mechercharimyces sp. CAU 1602]